MDNQWTKILLFSILSLVLGFILGKVTSSQRGCHRNAHGMHTEMHEGEKKSVRTIMWKSDDHENEAEGEIEAIIEDVEDSDFEGDTVIKVEGANISISKENGELKVNANINVEVEDEEGNRKKKVIVIDRDQDNTKY